MEAKNSLNEITAEQAKSAIKRLTDGYTGFYGPATINSTNCLLANKATNKKGDKGWVKCKVSNGQRNEIYVHRLALVAAERTDDISKLMIDGNQVSHLCHQSTCFESSHLIVETKNENLDRNKCHGWQWIKCPCCKLYLNPCQHTPRCILPKPDN